MTFTKADTVAILTNLDALGAAHIPDAKRAWAHIFIAAGLIQKELPDPEKLTRERFVELCGKVHDAIFSALESGVQS